MSSCSRSAEAVEYLLGLMSPESAMEYRLHLEACSDCASALEAEKQLDEQLRLSIAAPEILAARVEAALNLLKRRPGAWAFRLRVTGLAGVGAAGLLAFWRLGGGLVNGLLPRDAVQSVLQTGARFFETAGSSAATLVVVAAFVGVSLLVASAMPNR